MREWLGGMFAAGYLDYDAQQRYALSAEYVPTLATEPGARLSSAASARS